MATEDLSSYQAILRLTVPAILLNGASPSLPLLQTALLGHLSDAQDQLAAFAVTVAFSNFLLFLLNSVVGGSVDAKIARFTAQQNWSRLVSYAKRWMLAAAICGVIASVTMLLLLYPVQRALRLAEGVTEHMRIYWCLRAAMVPFQTWSMVMRAMLQGYERVGLNAWLTIGQAIVELIVSGLVLTVPVIPWWGSLRGLGVASLACAALSACVNSVAALGSSPTTAPASFRLLALPSTRARLNRIVTPRTSRVSPRTTQDSAVIFEGDRFVTPELVLGASVELEDDTVGGPLLAGEYDASVSGRSADGSDTSWCTGLFSFGADGASVYIRSALLQGTFLSAIWCASTLGTPALAAHQVVAQLWLITSFFVDGLAAAGTILGSRLGAMQHDAAAYKDLRLLSHRLLSLGVGTGILSGALFFFAEGSIIGLLTADGETKRLLHGPLWLVLCIVQPVNSGIFVYDGLLYASRALTFMRNSMIVGVSVVFVPGLIVSLCVVRSLWSIWAAMAALNIWRFLASLLFWHLGTT